ncbi:MULTISPECIES: FIST C-terminal domain-containing protein [Methylotenera]|uniref:FIST C-terminal domain-containing protein n=1 Tax=Methylotenera TaxID=359407 RepID=UPI000375781C|nr:MULTISPECIES: FIST C-terminal domain-containing protein [Methylotenera]
MKVATGLAIGNKALPELAAQAVLSAMQKAELDSPTCVLLFLTSEFAAKPQLAIKAAAKAASCTQIIGCSAIGIFTEEDWVIDSPAAAAMVFSENIWVKNTDKNQEENTGILNDKTNENFGLTKQSILLTLAAPSAINSSWLDSKSARFGGVSGDAIGHGAFSVWENAKGVTQGLCEMQLSNTDYAVGATHGLKLITSPRRVTACHQHDIQKVANLPALNTLKSAFNKHAANTAPTSQTSLPYHQLMAVHATHASQIERGDYSLATIIAGDESAGTVTLAKPLQVGDWLSWAVRDSDAAQIDLVKTATQLKQQLAVKPAFSLLFSNLGRGPYLYNGIDQDLALIKTLFPQLPLIGFYGNGEIAPILGKNTLLQYSAVLGLFGR